METITIEETTALLTNGKITLQPSQAKICFPIIERIFKKMILGIQFQGIKIAGNVIIDGHHRYIASLLAEVSLEEFPTKKTSATQIFTWPSVDIVVNDWDTEAKILMLNELDATFNDLDLNKLIEMLQ